MAALGADTSTSASTSTLSDDLNRFYGTDLGVLTNPAAMAQMSSPGGTVLGILGDPAAALAHMYAPSDGYRRFKLARDRDRPLEFDGRVVAQVEEASFGRQVLMRAAIYETRGGKFVAEMARRETTEVVDYGTGKRPFLFAKATVFDSLDVAAMSFRTQGGRLSEQLLKQIGDVDSEFIE